MENPKKKKEYSWGQIQFGGVDRSEDKTNFIKRESDYHMLSVGANFLNSLTRVYAKR